MGPALFVLGSIGASEIVTLLILKGFGVWHSVGMGGMGSGDIFTLVSQGRLWEGLTVWRVSDSFFQRTMWLWSSGEILAGRVEEECRALILRKISYFHRAFQAGRDWLTTQDLLLIGNFQQARKEEIP